MRNYKIIVADDVVDTRMLIEKMISPVCEICYEANNGQEIIDILSSKEIDIILTDIDMPKVNGLEATELIRKNFDSPKKDTPIIAITGYASLPFTERCKRFGINLVLSKPLNETEIIKAIERLCKYRK